MVEGAMAEAEAIWVAVVAVTLVAVGIWGEERCTRGTSADTKWVESVVPRCAEVIIWERPGEFDRVPADRSCRTMVRRMDSGRPVSHTWEEQALDEQETRSWGATGLLEIWAERGFLMRLASVETAGVVHSLAIMAESVEAIWDSHRERVASAVLARDTTESEESEGTRSRVDTADHSPIRT